MILKGLELTSFGFFTKIKPILVISKPVLSEEQVSKFRTGKVVHYTNEMFKKDWVNVYQSPKMDGNDVTFPLITIDSMKLCGGSMNYPIKARERGLIP